MENVETKLGAIEIAQNITTEEIKAMFFDANALRVPPYRLMQLNSRGNRYYYIEGEDKIELMPSVTTVLSRVMPRNPILEKWRADLGWEKADAYTMERAAVGSLVHTLIQGMMITRTFNLDSVRDSLAKYVETNRLPLSFMEHEEEIKAMLISFALWMQEYDVRPLGIEVALYHPILKYAGLTDCVADMRRYPVGDKHGDERIIALCDFKTTTKEFRDEHAIQLAMYREAWNIWFPETPITEIANVAPKDWMGTARKKPSYRFEWQTENPVIAQLPHLIELYKLLDAEQKKVVRFKGTISLDKSLEDNVEVLALEDLVKLRSEAKNEPSDEDNESLFDLFD